jgi:hypothetical protein
MIAVYLAVGYEPQHGLLPEICRYFQAAGIRRPQLSGYTCRLRGTPGRFSYAGKCDVSDWLIFTQVGGPDTVYALAEDITHLQVTYV